jgi:AcrR family transcriptional regulator
MVDLSRREREKRDRRQAILRAARSVFAGKGFDAATLDEIAELAEFSKGAIYGYFKNKDELFFSLIEEGLDELSGITRRVVESPASPVEKIRELVHGILRYAEENGEFFCIFTPERSGLTTKRHPEMKKRILPKYAEGIALMTGVMVDGIDSGVLKETDPVFLARILLGLISSTIGEWIVAGGRESIQQNAERISAIFLDGARIQRHRQEGNVATKPRKH